MPLDQVSVRSRIFTAAAICGTVDLAIARKANAIVIGHTASFGSAEAAAELARQWWAIGAHVIENVGLSARDGSLIAAVLTFTQADPDLWIVADTPSNWLPIARELVVASGWQAGKTLAFASQNDAWRPSLVAGLLDGLAGVDAAGNRWDVRDGYRFVEGDEP